MFKEINNNTNNNEYSTIDEVKIGTLIDGRPIYRKVFVNNGGGLHTGRAYSNWGDDITLDANIGLIINGFGFNSYTFPGSYNSISMIDGVSSTENTTTIRIQTDNNSTLHTLVLEYVKPISN